MKKIAAALLAVLLIFTCLCFSSCGLILGMFDVWLSDDDYGGNTNGGDDSDHVHQYDSYFTYSECSVDGCRVVGRAQGTNKYANDFKYTLTNAQINEIRGIYSEILTHIEDGDDYAQFEKLYYDYVDYLDYVAHQYQVASILSDVKYNSITAGNYNTASKLYNEMFANYYAIYELVYNSTYRDKFYEGWTADEIQAARYRAEIYGGSADNNNAVDDVLAEYNDFMEKLNWSLSGATRAQFNELSNLYGKLVVANNNVAASAHYGNYMDYAYENEYNRNYTPSEVADSMRNYVKTYVAPIFINVASKYYALSNLTSAADRNYYYGLMEDSLFTSTSDKNFNRVRTTIDFIGDYFEYMQTSRAFTGGAKFDFNSAVEDLFKNGNYFIGDYEGAYTWWIGAIEAPILYFGSNYDTAFTFVHEFGHYYQNVYNGSMHLSYDHDETHSQGNEMMFLAWLSQHKAAGVSNGFSYVEIEQLFDVLATIVISTAVDEFEQAAYSGVYEGEPIKDTYGNLFDKILSTYKGTYGGKEYDATDFLNTSYWGYVAFENAAYYISYAMSALPCLELYAMAQSNLDEARDAYVKLFTFANDTRFVSVDSYGNKFLKNGAIYEEILNFAGLKSPFERSMYTTLRTYFNNRKDLR